MACLSIEKSFSVICYVWVFVKWHCGAISLSDNDYYYYNLRGYKTNAAVASINTIRMDFYQYVIHSKMKSTSKSDDMERSYVDLVSS